MVVEQSEYIMAEVKKAFTGKDEIVKKVLMTIYAGGHILLEDCPGVGKTTLVLAFAKALGLDFKRVQFTTDTTPSDITGFTMLNKADNKFEYHEGAVMCNLLLADEINRTSPKTQSALLESMEERSVTVDGVTHELPHPFICIATQNPQGASGTHPLPESQLDRFMVKLSIGYPSCEDQIKILNARRYTNPLNEIKAIGNAQSISQVHDYLSSIKVTDDVMRYAITLCEETRKHPLVELGVSPRGVIALVTLSRANALIDRRNYVVPEDIQSVYADVCAHRLVLRPQSVVEGVSRNDILSEILTRVKPPATIRGSR